ncbi:MAG: hypothetical protein L0Y72_32410 [Gemmataceae bacterium]|nr:hypothetical protein [Gemmataceae bacterium]MCI0743759.1 hypothetical protein [Gemmataceae bacterium]
MTRETKVGLIVAGSFIALVSVVVVSRLRNQQEPPGDSYAQVNSKGQEGDGKKPTLQKPKGNGFEPAKFQLEPGQAPPLPRMEEKKSSDPLLPPIPDLPAPPSLPPVPGFETAQEDEHKKKLEALANAVIPKEAVIPGKPMPEALAPPPAINSGGIELPPLPDLPMTTRKDIELPPVVTIPPSAPKEVIPKTPEGAPPLPMVPAPTPMNPLSMSPPLPPVTEFNPLPKAPDVPVALPTTPKDNLPAVAIPPAPNSHDPKLPPIVNKELTNPALPPLGMENKNPPNGAPPLGMKPGAKLPDVKDYRIDTYFCQPEDTTFEALSQRFFRTSRFARALHQFNREHPLAKDNVRTDNPRLVAGQALFIPPAEFLQSRYQQFIGGESPAVPLGSNIPPIGKQPDGPVGLKPPVPPINTEPVPPISMPRPAVVPSTDVTKRYRVGGNGQMIIEIAQQTLGDPRRWSEIYRLNPNLRPELPIPAGTEIRLPANANVP